MLICLPSAIVGARLYYVIFEWDQFFGPGIPWYRFLDIRSGGLAIYGGVIGAVLGMLIYTRVRKFKVLPFLDLTGIGLLLGQAIGRWGNFFNREAHGGVTTCFLRMGLVENGALQYFHPTFLYESVWNLTGFVVLHFLSKKRKFDGQMFLAYLAWYGAGRMVIEGLRTDSLWLGPVRVSQLLAAVTMLLSLGILLYQAIFVRHDPAKMQVNRVAAAEAAAATAAETQPEETAEPEDAASEPEDGVSEETESSEEAKE
ncbi:MAG: prolipoprotein diacylglyceryl transferase [Oscillospiraceae bacterium]